MVGGYQPSLAPKPEGTDMSGRRQAVGWLRLFFAPSGNPQQGLPCCPWL